MAEGFIGTSDGTAGSLLIETKIYDTLIEAVNKKLIGRGLAAIDIQAGSIPGSSVDLNLATADSMKVFAVAEGASIPMDKMAYTNTNMKPVKYGVRIAITKEMQEDGKWDLMAHSVKCAGIEMAENLDALIIAVLDGATNVQAGGAALTVADITRAMQYLEDYDYTPTDILVGPTVCNDIRNIDTFAEADKYGAGAANTAGLVGNIYGMNVVRFSANIGNTLYAYVIDRNHAFAVAEKRPITVTDYNDATHDLSGASVTQRIVVALVRDYAVCRITTS